MLRFAGPDSCLRSTNWRRGGVGKLQQKAEIGFTGCSKRDLGREQHFPRGVRYLLTKAVWKTTSDRKRFSATTLGGEDSVNKPLAHYTQTGDAALWELDLHFAARYAGAGGRRFPRSSSAGALLLMIRDR